MDSICNLYKAACTFTPYTSIFTDYPHLLQLFAVQQARSFFFFFFLASFHKNNCPELNSQPFPLKIGSFDSQQRGNMAFVCTSLVHHQKGLLKRAQSLPRRHMLLSGFARLVCGYLVGTSNLRQTNVCLFCVGRRPSLPQCL
jgi:hypothetical protein